MSIINQSILNILVAICKPVARFCLRNAIGIQQATEALKKVFIETAQEMIEESGNIANVSRLSIATGLQRRDVQRLMEQEKEPRQAPHALSRIIAAWETHQKFLTSHGKPKVLSIEGTDSEFNSLVRFITSDLHPGTVLFQLEHMGAVEKTPHGVKLRAGAADIKRDPEKAYQLLAQDLTDLPNVVEQNVFTEREIPHLHARTEYDNILLDALPQIEDWLLKEGSLFHQRARTFISQYDQDLHPHKKGEAKGKVALITFSTSSKPKLKVTLKKKGSK